MGRYDERWSAEQKAAVEHYALDLGWSGAKVWKTANTRGLGQLEPFAMPLSTCRTVIRKARERRARETLPAIGPHGLQREMAETIARMIGLGKHELAKLESRARARNGRLDIPRYDQLGKALERVQRLAAAHQPPSTPSPEDGKPETAEDELLSEIGRDLRKPAQQDPASTHTESRDREAANGSRKQEARAGGVPGREAIRGRRAAAELRQELEQGAGRAPA